MIRRAALAASILVLFAVNVAAAANATVTIKDFAFTNGSPTVGLGNSVTWKYPIGGFHHTSTSILPVSKWGAMAWSFAFNSPSKTFSPSQTFDQAGSWSYHCLIHSFMTGTVHVSFSSSSTNAVLGTTFTLTLGDRGLPTGFVHDVQKRKAGGSWATWKSPTTKTQTWKPTKPGTYQFRTRVRQMAAPQQTSGWSPTISITVS
jgi:plastocyanin